MDVVLVRRSRVAVGLKRRRIDWILDRFGLAWKMGQTQSSWFWGIAVTSYGFPTRRHVASWESVDVSTHSKKCGCSPTRSDLVKPVVGGLRRAIVNRQSPIANRLAMVGIWRLGLKIWSFRGGGGQSDPVAPGPTSFGPAARGGVTGDEPSPPRGLGQSWSRWMETGVLWDRRLGSKRRPARGDARPTGRRRTRRLQIGVRLGSTCGSSPARSDPVKPVFGCLRRAIVNRQSPIADGPEA
jgi:hypothetical protein